MPRGKFKKIIEQKEIDLNKFQIFRINKNKTIIYRCKFCFRSRLKFQKNKLYKISGHDKNCCVIKRANSKECFSKNNTIKNTNVSSIQSEFQTKPNTEFISEKILDNNKSKNKIKNKFIPHFNRNEFNEIIINDKNLYFSLLVNIFDKQNSLNKFQEEIGLYYIDRKKQLGEGSHSKVFLGEDKFHRIKVAILEMEANDIDSYNTETFILSRINGKGNFPSLYNIYTDDDHYYLVESLMGPNLKSLYKICNKIFDYYTILNIAYDLIKNIKVFHELGYIHRDLKPDNLVYSNLSYENNDKKDEIGIIDFSNSKINIGQDGYTKYSNKMVKCQGNKCFSSSNALKDKDVRKKDDIISIFYILIYFFCQTLPWNIKKLNGEHLSKSEILEIRNNISIKQICKNFPKDFVNLTEFVFDMPESENPNYSFILEQLEKMRNNEKNKLINSKNKFCWIELIKQYSEKSKNIDEITKKQIKLLFDNYCIKPKEFLEYINY